MKTFETEKHNIPEGATHYSDETSYTTFCWFKLKGTSWYLRGEKEQEWLVCDSSGWIRNTAKPIPQTKKVGTEVTEWGSSCRHKDSLGVIHSDFVYLCINPFDGRAMICKSEGEEMDVISVMREDLLPPETDAERIAREELESAYDFYRKIQEVTDAVACDTFEAFKDNTRAVKLWKAIVKESGYAKEGIEDE